MVLRLSRFQSKLKLPYTRNCRFQVARIMTCWMRIPGWSTIYLHNIRYLNIRRSHSRCRWGSLRSFNSFLITPHLHRLAFSSFFFFSFLFYCHKERGAENQVQEKLYAKLYRFQFIFMDSVAAGQITTILSLCRSYQIESALSTLLEAYHKIVWDTSLIKSREKTKVKNSAIKVKE